MPFTPITVTDGVTPANATWGNNAQTQYTEATQSLEQDLFTACIFSGFVASKDGTIANQLDVTAGVGLLLQADSTLRRRAVTSSTQTTSTPSTTYYLFLNVDGTWTWGTASSGPTNSLAICQATTDGSGNILVVTDKRTLYTKFLAGAVGPVMLPTMRNGVLTEVAIYTGASTPTGDGVTTPATGSVWIKQ